MSGVNKTIDSEGITALRGIIGKRIESIDAYIVARDNVAWRAVRINCDGTALDIINELEHLPINDEGDTEEMSSLRVMSSETDVLAVDDVDTGASTCEIGTTVTGVTLVNGRVVTRDCGRVIADRAYTQAIAFGLSSGESLVLDKGAWFSEMIAIGMGDPEDLVYDDALDWEDDPEDPDVHFSWSRSLIRL